MCRTKERRQLNKQMTWKFITTKIFCLIKLYSKKSKLSIVLCYFPQNSTNLTNSLVIIKQIDHKTREKFVKTFSCVRGFAGFWEKPKKRRCFEEKYEIFLRKGLTKRFVCGIIIKPLVQGFLKKHSALPFHSEFLKKRYEICTQ